MRSLSLSKCRANQARFDHSANSSAALDKLALVQSPRNKMIPYRQFYHTADLGIEVFGGTVGELFTNAAFAIFDLITDLNLVETRQIRTISAEGIDQDDLLVNFLREALYLFNGGRWLAKKFTLLEFGNNRLVARAEGEPFDPARHRIETELKAVTYHQLGIGKTPEGFTTKVVFDV